MHYQKFAGTLFFPGKISNILKIGNKTLVSSNTFGENASKKTKQKKNKHNKQTKKMLICFAARAKTLP